LPTLRQGAKKHSSSNLPFRQPEDSDRLGMDASILRSCAAADRSRLHEGMATFLQYSHQHGYGEHAPSVRIRLRVKPSER
jgi:hypothetical protein